MKDTEWAEFLFNLNISKNSNNTIIFQKNKKLHPFLNLPSKERVISVYDGLTLKSIKCPQGGGFPRIIEIALFLFCFLIILYTVIKEPLAFKAFHVVAFTFLISHRAQQLMLLMI